LIDFGLARVWRTPDGVVRPRGQLLGFTGTYRYASIRSHDGEELSCRDDLTSLLYILVEMVAPPLPWHRQEDRDTVVEIKKEAKSKLLIGLPAQFQEIQDYIDGLRYEDFPDYDWLTGKLTELKQIGEREEQLTNETSGFGARISIAVLPLEGEAQAQESSSDAQTEKRKCCCCDVG
jgi:hypothetical protein